MDSDALPVNHTMLRYATHSPLGNPALGSAVTDEVIGGHRTGVSHSYQFSVGWTAIVISRDTALFYNITSGRATTGTMSASGVYSGRQSFYLGKHWTNIVASCDTILLYESTTGEGIVGTLTGGYFNKTHDYGTTFSKGWTHIVSGCGTAMFYNATTGRAAVGVLKAGAFTQHHSYPLKPGWQDLAASDDSIVFHKVVDAPPNDEGATHGNAVAWGRLYAGGFSRTDSTISPLCDGTSTLSCFVGYAGGADTYGASFLEQHATQVHYEKLTHGIIDSADDYACSSVCGDADDAFLLAGGR